MKSKASIQGKRSVNISMASSGKGLKEELLKIARKRAVTASKVVAQIYEFAINNQGLFPSEIDNPREKPGAHISTQVSSHVAEQLDQWAKSMGRSRAGHCCFVLEHSINDKELQKKIFTRV